MATSLPLRQRDTYAYDEINERQIRLISIHSAKDGDENLVECSLSTHDLPDEREPPSYTALSYTWGEVSGGSEVLLDGKRMYARPNLYAALKSLRYHNLSRYYWIDAICINQQDDAEKSVQVAKMGQIYSKAKLVAICLVADETGAANFFSAAENFRQNYQPPHFLGGTESDKAAVKWLARNPYFRRLWIVQENRLAADRVLLCGRHQIPFWYVAHMVGESEHYGSDQVTHGELIKSSGLEHICDLMPNPERPKDEPPAPTVFNALKRYGQQLCFDRRDRIYGLLGLPEMQKPKIRHHCGANSKQMYQKDIRDFFLDLLVWFESSPALAGQRQDQLRRYSLLQSTFGSMSSIFSGCALSDKSDTAAFEKCWVEVRTHAGRTENLPFVLIDSRYKGKVSAVAEKEETGAILRELNAADDKDVVKDNLYLLDLLRTGIQPYQPILAFAPESEHAAMRSLPNLGKEAIAHDLSQNKSWCKIETTSGGWGIASAGAKVDDVLYSIVVDQTQNNMPIICMLILREKSNGLYSVVGYALDHLGFRSPGRKRPNNIVIAPMPPSIKRAGRPPDVKLAIDPKVALHITDPDGCRSLGFGWFTKEERRW